jgi:hypothetical protein
MGSSARGQVVVCLPLVGIDRGVSARVRFDKGLQGGAITVAAHL